LFKGWQLPVAVLHLSTELGELLQWLGHDDSTLNIVLSIAITMDSPGSVPAEIYDNVRNVI